MTTPVAKTATSTGKPTITSTTDLSPTTSRWLGLKQITYTDAIGTSRTWESAVRKTKSTSSSSVDAVAIGNILLSPNAPPATMLVIQYRPPLDAYTVEWPAGLVDAGETAEEAAIREMKEETGFEGRILDMGPAVASDPGMTSATLRLVMMEMEIDGGKGLPEQRLDDGEAIERVVVPLAELYERLNGWSEEGRYVVAGKLWYFAKGMDFARRAKYF